MIERLKPTGRTETGMQSSQSSLRGLSSERVHFTTSAIDGTKNNNSDHSWSRVNGFSKETADTWSVLGNMSSSSSNLSTIVGNPLAKMAQPKYLVASQQEHMPTSEGIICKALNVVSDESSRSSAEHEQSLKKVAKKRRKENDEDGLSSSILQFSKSSKEFLRKTQQSLKDSFHSRAASPEEKAQQSTPLQASLQSIYHPDNQRRGLLTSMVVQSQRSQASMMAQQQEPEPQDEATVATASSRSYESISSNNPYGYEDPDQSISSSNPYGYEDPDQSAATLAPIQVTRVGVARRRGSVTKFSLQDTAAAAVATDRIMKLQLHQQGTRAYTFSSGDSATAATRQRSLLRQQQVQQRDGSPDLSRASSVPRRQGSLVSMGEKEDSTAKPRRLRSLRMMMGDGGQTNEVSSLAGGLDRLSAPLRQRSLRRTTSPSNFNNKTLSTFPDTSTTEQVQEKPSHSRGSMPETTASNPYGYEDPDEPSRWKAHAAPQDAQTNQPQTTAGTSNQYGYEDPDSFAQHRRTTDQNSNPYGYGDDEPEVQVQQPIARPQRRHPRPQRRGSVTKFSIQAQFKVIDSEVVITQNNNNNNKTIVPMAVDDPTPSRGAPTLATAAPERQPTTVAWQHRETLKAQQAPPSPFESRKTALANRSSSFQASQVQRSESMRSRGSNNKNLHDDSDSNDSDDSSMASFEDEDFCDLTIPIDGVPKSPIRSDSFRSRSDSFRSFSSDASGLEADMQSLCSISRHDHEPLSPPPPPPSFLSRTPTPKSGSRKSHMTPKKTVARQASFGQELREKLKNEKSASFSSALGGGTTPFITFETAGMSPRLPFKGSPRMYGCVRTPSNSKKMLSPKLGTPATCASTTVSSIHSHASALLMPPPNLSPSMTAGRKSIRKQQGELSNL